MTAKSTPRDVFLYLLQTVALYVVTFSFLALVFNLIDAWLPDPLDYYRAIGSGLRWAIASLIVIFPVLVWASRLLIRDRLNQPEKSELRVRKWLLYLTLFLTGGLIIGDLISLIFNFLEGDLTTRFVFKVLSILVVAGAIFWYYLTEIKVEMKGFASFARWFGWVTGAVVLIGVIAGFFLAGSPFAQRELRFDQQRISDLQVIQSQIVYFWQQKGELPESLADLTDEIIGFTAPLDPATKTPYGYMVLGDLEFELCATFARATADDPLYSREAYPVAFADENWEHPVGEQCFERTIDPELHGVSGPTKPVPMF